MSIMPSVIATCHNALEEEMFLITKYITSMDGAKIAYQTFGKGPALLLVHGSGNLDKSIWKEMGWIDVLEKEFFVITPDIRGYGESDKSYDQSFYTIDKILKDFGMVIEKCGFSEAYYFGHSYGATIGLQASKTNSRFKKVVCAGSHFGDEFFKVVIPEQIREFEILNDKKKSDSLHELDLSPEEKTWILETDLDLRLAQFKAWNNWSGIDPKDIKTKLAIYSGTNDNELVLKNLRMLETEMKEYDIAMKIFENLNHVDLISKIDTVMPWILEFLKS